MEVAYRIYPIPNGTIYTETDITTIDDVIELFDYCQISETMISKDGWEFLINKFGLEKLYEANLKSDWLDTENMESFLMDVEYEKENAYSAYSEHSAIRDFFESTHFPAP